MLIMRVGTTGELRVYEPEPPTGDHFMEFTRTVVSRADFRDMPDVQVYYYVRVIGSNTPKTVPPRMFAVPAELVVDNG